MASFLQRRHSRQALELFERCLRISSPSTMRPPLAEQKLFVIYLEHRMCAFQGTFHANPITLYDTSGARCRGI